jgi:hypothetical protein
VWAGADFVQDKRTDVSSDAVSHRATFVSLFASLTFRISTTSGLRLLIAPAVNFPSWAVVHFVLPHHKYATVCRRILFLRRRCLFFRKRLKTYMFKLSLPDFDF